MREINIINLKYDKEILLNKLFSSEIKINEYARLIFDYPHYNYKNSLNQITIIELTLYELGLNNGGNFKQIENEMKKKNFDYCPVEFAPYIRLYYKSQISSNIESKNQHPPDSILIFSKPIRMSEEFPKGFYIRNINGTLWLRGYVCSEDYFWESNTQLILKKIL